MPDKTWKAVERRIAAAHGTTRTGPTGRLGPDAVNNWLAIQVKHRKVLPQWMGDALRLIRSQAQPGQLGIVVAHEAGDRDSWVIMSHQDFLDWFGGQKDAATIRDQGEGGTERHDAGRVRQRSQCRDLDCAEAPLGARRVDRQGRWEVGEAMTFDAYQRASARTINTDLDYQDQLANAGLGISDEAGEVAGVIKKMLYQGNPANPTKIADEMGDVLWYLALLATTMGFSLGDVAAANVKKLEARYPKGFRAEDSVDRVR